MLNGRDLRVVDELFAPGFVGRFSNYPDINLEQFKQALQMSHAALPDLRVSIEDQIAAADKVVTRWLGHGTHAGEFAGIPPSGERLTLTAIHIHRVLDDQIAELWEEFNFLNVIQPDGDLMRLLQKLKP